MKNDEVVSSLVGRNRKNRAKFSNNLNVAQAIRAIGLHRSDGLASEIVLNPDT